LVERLWIKSAVFNRNPPNLFSPFVLLNNIEDISLEAFCSGCGIKEHKCSIFKPCIYPLCRDPMKNPDSEKDWKNYQETHSILNCPTVKKYCKTCEERGHHNDDHIKFDQVFV